MNDLEEVRFGLIEGEKAVFSSADLTAALGTPEGRNLFMHAFNFYGVDYIENYLNDTYVLCFSEHDPADNDGRLSMWRGYGGNGRGAAIVIDTAKFSTLPTSPLILAAVEYETTEGRQTWLADIAWVTAATSGVAIRGRRTNHTKSSNLYPSATPVRRRQRLARNGLRNTAVLRRFALRRTLEICSNTH